MMSYTYMVVKVSSSKFIKSHDVCMYIKITRLALNLAISEDWFTIGMLERSYLWSPD